MDIDAMSILREAGVDTEGALVRLMNNQAFYLKMLGKFQQDTNFAKLRSLIEAGEGQAAGECAHALKGMCATLGLTELSDLCAKLQYIYLGREEGDPAPVFALAEESYAKAMDAMRRALAG